MSMNVSTSAQNTLTNEPNVVPMIDILLVLLIIFMLVIPLSRKAIDLQLPDPNPPASSGPLQAGIDGGVPQKGILSRRHIFSTKNWLCSLAAHQSSCFVLWLLSNEVTTLLTVV